jgi:hypothetical protein
MAEQKSVQLRQPLQQLSSTCLNDIGLFPETSHISFVLHKPDFKVSTLNSLDVQLHCIQFGTDI